MEGKRNLTKENLKLFLAGKKKLCKKKKIKKNKLQNQLMNFTISVRMITFEPFPEVLREY